MKNTTHMTLAIIAASAMFTAPGIVEGATWYVKWDAAGLNNGSSWDDAFTDLQGAITAAQNAAATMQECFDEPSRCEIWVSPGTFRFMSLAVPHPWHLFFEIWVRFFACPRSRGQECGFLGSFRNFTLESWC